MQWQETTLMSKCGIAETMQVQRNEQQWERWDYRESPQEALWDTWDDKDPLQGSEVGHLKQDKTASVNESKTPGVTEHTLKVVVKHLGWHGTIWESSSWKPRRKLRHLMSGTETPVVTQSHSCKGQMDTWNDTTVKGSGTAEIMHNHLTEQQWDTCGDGQREEWDWRVNE